MVGLSCELFKKHLAVEEIEEKLAFAIRQVGLRDQRLDFVTPY